MHRPLRRRLDVRARAALNPFTAPVYERPGTHGWASIALTAFSALSSAAGSMQKGQAESDAAQYQAAVARNNQIVAQQNATYARQKGEVMEAEKRQRTAQFIGAQRAKIGASGITLDSGSPLRIQSDIAQLGEIDALTIRNNAAREAYGWESQGVNYAAEAQLDQMRAGNAETSGMLGAFSSIIGGASSVSSKWNSFKSAGVEGFSS